MLDNQDADYYNNHKKRRKGKGSGMRRQKLTPRFETDNIFAEDEWRILK